MAEGVERPEERRWTILSRRDWPEGTDSLMMPKSPRPQPDADLEVIEVVPLASLERVREENDRLAEALRPFSALADEADGFGHESGSTCSWRLAYDDLVLARSALASLDREEESG